MSGSKVGFPPPLLGDQPLRLSVLFHREGLLILEKPPGINGSPSRWEPQTVPCITRALRVQIEAGKPELDRLGIRYGAPIYSPEPHSSGAVVLVSDPEQLDRWRNAFGSGHFHFRFLLPAGNLPALPNQLTCDLPLAVHRDNGSILVSHRTGKKALTHFQRVASSPSADLWEARTNFPRRERTQVHAREVGIPGAAASAPPPHLREVAIDDAIMPRPVRVPFPTPFRRWIRQNKLGIGKDISEPTFFPQD